MNRRQATLVITLSALMALAGCDYLPFGYTPIKDIVAAPTNFEGKEVKLKGTVTDLTKVPILDLNSFVLDDGTGEIIVISPPRAPLALKQTVRIKGVVTSPAIIAGQSLGLHVKETKRLQ